MAEGGEIEWRLEKPHGQNRDFTVSGRDQKPEDQNGQGMCHGKPQALVPIVRSHSELHHQADVWVINEFLPTSALARVRIGLENKGGGEVS